jgi:hypothetical protein
MKRTLHSLLSLLATLAAINTSHGQQHDKYWMGKIWGEFTSILMGFEGGSISYVVAADSTPISITSGTKAMSNAEGELQFYTNGNAVASWDHSIMQGGKGFNEGSPISDFGINGADTLYNTSYAFFAYQIMPDGAKDNVYYMVHSFLLYDDDNSCKQYKVPRLQISKIDMSANGGRGKVVYKNRSLDEGPMAPFFAVVRHGNGRDWWVVGRSQDGLDYRSTLLQRDSAVQTVVSSVPGLGTDWFECEDWAFTNLNLLHVSPDCSRLLDTYGRGRAKLLDFDRCSGQVSLLDTFTTGLPLLQTDFGLVECPAYFYEFSPSGRYLYGIGWAGAAQWDLWADDIAASKVPLGGVPWQLDNDQDVWVGLVGGFSAFAHGPDGKIYNLTVNVHSVIEHPDEPGETSGYCLAADNAPGSCLGPDVPYYLYSPSPLPNYRLGPLVGSGCDTILSSTGQPVASSGYGVTASPTVSSGPVEVAITLPGYGSQVAAEIQVVDMLGRVVERHRFPPYAYLHRLDVSGWSAGVYQVVLLENGRPKAGARLVVGR